jgi:hypothetical protein
MPKGYKLSGHHVLCRTNSECCIVSSKVSKTHVTLTPEIYFGEIVRGVIDITGNEYGRVTVTAGEATFESSFGGDWMETVG